MDENENEGVSLIESNLTDSASDDDQHTATTASSSISASSSSLVIPRQPQQKQPSLASPMTRSTASMNLSVAPANSHPHLGSKSKASSSRPHGSQAPVMNLPVAVAGDVRHSQQKSSNSSSNESLANSSTRKCESPAKNLAPRNRSHVANRAPSSGHAAQTTSSPNSSFRIENSPTSSPVERIVPVVSTTQTHMVPFFTNVSPVTNSTPGRNPDSPVSDASSPSSQRAPPVHNWQSMKLSMAERLAFLFNNETLSDVKFLVGRGSAQQRIPAHKFILSIGSAVFNAMFNGSMATNATEIDLPDVEPAAFMFLLRFLYTDEAHIGPETVMTTLYTAKKYAVPALECQCVEFLKRNLNAENAFMLLSQARLFDEQQLADLCLETIDKCTTEAINAEGFVDIDMETLCLVLRRDTLSIRECKLFQAVVRWADAECQRQQIASSAENKRAVLGDAASLIRFPLMSVEEFASCAQTKILKDKEIVDLFLYFTCNPKPKVQFVDKPRCYLSGCEYTLTRFKQVDCRWGYSGTPDKIRFRVNQKIHIVGLALYGSTQLPTEYQVSVQITHDESGKVCGDNDTSFSSDGSASTFRVMFREPVEVRPHNSYTASATIAGADSHYGTKGLRKVHIDTPDGKIVFHFQHSPGNNNGTSVEDGQIPQFIFYT